MLKQNIKIGPHNYVCELYKYYELDRVVTGNYSLLRDINIFNYIAVDSNIYVIDNELIETIDKGVKKLKSGVIFPVSSALEQFSTNIEEFTNVENLYPLLDDSFNTKNIRCDKIRIYHPLTKVNNDDIIISVNNVINGINFHYIVKKYNECTNYARSEFKVHNDVYSEYIEFYIPCVEDLISYNTYFIEDTNSCNIDTKYIDHIEGEERVRNIPYSKLIKHIENNDETITYCSTYLFNIPFTVETLNKVYIPETEQCIENMYITYPINLILYPFSELTEDGIYIAHSKYNANLDVFVSSPNISLKANLDFNDYGKLVVKSKFIYPELKDTTFANIQEAYEYFNGISLDKYEGIYYEDNEELEESGDIIEINSANTPTSFQFKQFQCVYNITLASDMEFKNVIYSSPNYWHDEDGGDVEENETPATPEMSQDTLLNVIVNKEFEIPVFSNWEQLPELLVCKVTFTDRYLGTQMESNFVVITKDYYKYIVNYENDYINAYKLILDKEDMNFYDKIVCNVKVTENTNNNISNLTNTNTRVIYKPVFYKTQDLQNVKLQGTVTQNIGINLGNYMSKVDTFFMIIDNVRFIETGRNDMYVIFNVQANKLTNKFGTYYVTNEEDEYISSGNWSII